MIETAVSPPPQTVNIPWRTFVAGIILALLSAAAMMEFVLKAPLSDLTTLVSTLSITSLASLILGYFLYARGWSQSPTLRLTLIMTYAWSAILILINVWFMLSQMYISQHDLLLSGVLLLFAVIISTTFGIFVAANVTDNLKKLASSAQQIATGNLDTRVTIRGKNEVAQVGTIFNEMAAQLQEAAKEQKEIERLRRDLIAWTSHDLRTPLTSIRALIEALHDGMVDDQETVQRYYRTIRADIIALNTLIDDLFELAQLDTGGLVLEMSSHSLSDIVSDTLESFQAIAEQRHIQLSGEIGENLDPVMLNSPKISRVLSNLVSNAMRYSPSNSNVHLKAWRDGNEIFLTVQDNGTGFKEEDLPRVFEQFFRGEQARSRSTGGAGLGLAIAQGLVEAHNGHIWAENVASGGALVGFSLPA